MFTHTTTCQAKRATQQQKVDEYHNQWPHACIACNATGVFESFQNHPYGSTLATEYFEEWCGSCLDNGICPRCGEEIPAFEDIERLEDIVCSHCQWRGRDYTATSPTPYICPHDEMGNEDCDGHYIFD